jgi:hypothetical protein
LGAPSKILTDILQQLNATRRRQTSVTLRSGLILLGTVSTLALAVAGLVELGFRLDTTGRTLLFLGVVTFVGGVFAWHVAPSLLRSLGLIRSADDFVLAALIGSKFPAIHDRLVNILQLHREMETGKSLYSPELVDASFQDLAEQIKGLDFASTVDSSPIKRSLRVFGATLLGAALLVLASPSQFLDSLSRIIHFRTEYAIPSEFTFEVSPGNSEVVKGQSVEISVRVRATSPASSFLTKRTLDFFWRLEGTEVFESAVLRADSTDAFTTTLQSLRGTTEYYATISSAESQRYRLVVVDRSVFRSLQVRLDYPAYTRLPAKLQQEFVGDVTALPGTTVNVSGIASKDLLKGQIVFGAGKPVPLVIENQKFRGSFHLVSETDYHFEVTDTENLTNADPVSYQLRIIPDESPAVAIVEPGRNIDLAGDKFIRLIMQAKDDFGFSSLRIGYRLTHSRYEKPWETARFVPVPLSSSVSAELEAPFTWDLSVLRLVPEDVIEYFAEVFDNDIVNGPKSGRSQTYLIRLPSFDEVFAELDKSHEVSLDDLKQTLQDAKQLKEKIESIDQDMKKNKEMDWQQQKKLEEMAKKYQDLQKKLDDIQKRLDEMVQKMDQQQVLSNETMQKYMELQQLFEQLNSAELQQALKQMQQAMQNVSKEQLQQALQKLTFSEERFRKSIERTIELLKRIQIEQKLDEARKRAEELEKSQKELNEETAKVGDDQQKRDELAKKQSDMAGKQQQLEKQTADVQQRMEDFFTEMPAEKMQKLNSEMQQQKLAGQMNLAGSQMQSGQMQQAQSTQQQLSQRLENQSKQLQSIQQEMLQKQMQYTLNELRRAANNMLELSKREEALKQESQSAPLNSPQLRENAQDQMRVMQDMGNVLRGLSELSKRSFAVTPEMGRTIGEALSHMRSALTALESRNGFMASQEEGFAMGSLNKTAQQIQSAMQNMMQQGSSGMGGLMQQLQMMAGQQQSINLQTQSLQAAAEAARLAVEQDAVRKSLEQLNREAQASGEQKRMLGDLDKIAEEMREVVRNLEQNNVNSETIRRQERILSRLLDASKSMRERDFEKRRKAQTGTEIARRSPGDLDPSALEGRNKLLEDLMKSLEHGYSKDYKELIRKYFEELQKLELQKK